MSDTLKTFSRGLDRLIDAMPPEGETEAFNQWLDKLRNHVTKTRMEIRAEKEAEEGLFTKKELLDLFTAFSRPLEKGDLRRLAGLMQRYVDAGATQDEIAKKLGLERTAVVRVLALQKLPHAMADAVVDRIAGYRLCKAYEIYPAETERQVKRELQASEIISRRRAEDILLRVTGSKPRERGKYQVDRLHDLLRELAVRNGEWGTAEEPSSDMVKLLAKAFGAGASGEELASAVRNGNGCAFVNVVLSECTDHLTEGTALTAMKDFKPSFAPVVTPEDKEVQSFEDKLSARCYWAWHWLKNCQAQTDAFLPELFLGATLEKVEETMDALRRQGMGRIEADGREEDGRFVLSLWATRRDPVNELQERIRYWLSLGLMNCMPGQLANLSSLLKEDLQKTGIEVVVRRRYRITPRNWEKFRKIEVLPDDILHMAPSLYAASELADAWKRNSDIVCRWAAEIKTKEGEDYLLTGPAMDELKKAIETDEAEE